MTSFPLPPPGIADTAVSAAGQTIMEVSIAVGFLAVYGCAVRLGLKNRTWVPVAIAVGSTFSALVEPLPDVVADLWYYAPGQHTMYVSLGNSLPVWTFFSYTVFYGGLGLLVWYLIERGLDRRRILAAAVVIAAGLAGAELFMINVMRLYAYYGPSYFVVGHFPVWICLLNTAIVLVIGTGAAWIRRSLTRRNQVIAAFFLPAVSIVLGLFFVPMVVSTAIHTTDPSMALVLPATLVTIGLAISMSLAALRLVPLAGWTPAAPESTPQDL